MDNEIWKPVVDAVGVYEVSNKGRLRCLIQDQGHRKRVLKPGVNYADYENYRYKKNDGKYRYVGIQRIMMESFVPVPDELKHLIGTRYLQVNHKDENPRNNTLENLEWCSAKYNTNYGTAMRRKIETRNQTGVRGAMVKVKQISLTGELIRIWDSMAEASNELGIFKSQICCCCKGKQKTAGGYRWEYADKKGTYTVTDSTKAKMSQSYTRKKKVARCDSSGTIIEVYDSVKAASLVMSTTPTNIKACCIGKTSQAKGFIWKYIE